DLVPRHGRGDGRPRGRRRSGSAGAHRPHPGAALRGGAGRRGRRGRARGRHRGARAAGSAGRRGRGGEGALRLDRGDPWSRLEVRGRLGARRGRRRSPDRLVVGAAVPHVPRAGRCRARGRRLADPAPSDPGDRSVVRRGHGARPARGSAQRRRARPGPRGVGMGRRRRHLPAALAHLPPRHGVRRCAAVRRPRHRPGLPRLGRAARRCLRGLPPRRDRRDPAHAAADSRPAGVPVRTVHAARRPDRRRVGRLDRWVLHRHVL
ncbi:MAG: hypothetical protein AVDCRST_MAG47-1867, partial [uncultured Nocardioidaceae bacterium]